MMKYFGLLQIGPQTRKVAILVTGVIIGQSSLILATPFLTRLFTPDEFGVYAILISTLSIITPVAALRLELSIPISKSQQEAWHSFLLSGIATCFLALLLCSIIGLWPNLVSDLIGMPSELSWILWALPAGVLLSGLQQSLGYWNIRNSHHLNVSQSRGGYGIVTASSQLLMGVYNNSSASLVGGEILGRLFACAWLMIKVMPAYTKELITSTSTRTLGRVAGTFRRFAFISTPSTLINMLSIYLPIIIIGKIISLEAAGLLLLAQRIIGLPTSLLVSSVSQIFVTEFTQTETKRDRTSLYRLTIKRYAIMTGPIFLILGLLSPFLFPYIFGQNWEESGLLAATLAPFYFLQLLSGSTVSALDMLQAHWLRLGRELIFLTGTVMILISGFHFDLSMLTIVVNYSMFGSSFYLISLILIHKIILNTNMP